VAERLDERAAVPVDPLALHRRADLVAGALPAALGRLAQALAREPQAPVQRRPAHDLGVHEVPRLAAPLPQAAVGLAPGLGGAVDQVHQEAPVVVVGRMAAPVPPIGEIDEQAQRIELKLRSCAVADAHRASAAIALEVELELGDPALAAHPVRDVSGPSVARGREVDEAAEAVGLVLVAEVGEGTDREGRVAHPGITVVPVAHTARGLGQRGGRGSGHSAGRLVGQRPEHQRRALDAGRFGRPQVGGPLRPVPPRRLGPVQEPVDRFGVEVGDTLASSVPGRQKRSHRRARSPPRAVTRAARSWAPSGSR
jgi:hypothetical protein